jgi:hypothetical protein
VVGKSTRVPLWYLSWLPVYREMKRVRQDDTEGWKQRVVLNVSGRQIETSITTLNKSSYFRGMFDSAVPDEVVFVDADPNAFELLLRFMRRGAVNLALPV